MVLVLILISLSLIFPLSLSRPSFLIPQVRAEEACSLDQCEKDDDEIEAYLECVKEQQACLENKIDQTQQQAQTLQNAINVINGEVQLQQLQVSQTLAEINQLETEIDELGERIDGLSLSLDRLTDMLIARIQQSYKQHRTTPLIALFASESFTDFVLQFKYLSQAELQTAKAMEQAESQRQLYDQQKSLKEVKQDRLQEKQAQLEQQRLVLEQKKQSKQRLLTETKNDEQTYQKLLYQAKKEIASLKNYAKSQIGAETCLGSEPGQPDGWYWSQRDPRWCQQRIGASNEVMGEVGCLITSTAMIWQKHGHDRQPSEIATNEDYFSLNTAYMKNPLPAPPGYKYNRYDYRDLDLIDQELSADRPVIVHLAIGGDGHFIVIKEGADGDYIINDPLFGADVPLDGRYNVSMIDSIRTFTPS
jgi:peptidoglycan hydrolase CwlO-like protein